MDKRTAIQLTGNDLTYKDVVAIGIRDKRVDLDPGALTRCRESRDFLEQAIREKKIIYGVNTSFGPMCNKIINEKDIETLQKLLTHRGKIYSRKRSGNCAGCQRKVKNAIKRARFMALLPFCA